MPFMPLHCSLSTALCAIAGRSSAAWQCRSVSHSCCLLTNGRNSRRRLNWDSISPDKSFSLEQALESVSALEADANSPEQASSSSSSSSKKPQAEKPSDPLLSLTRDDVAFVRSQLSPLRPPTDELESATETTMSTTTTTGGSEATAKSAPCRFWGVVDDGLRAATSKQRVSSASDSSATPTYDACASWELSKLVLRPAFNHWQEQIQLTMEGKLWRFPIDNEQDRRLEEEGELGFEHHVFLERHLQDWAPKTGPIRHFMETVCCGLSQNPFMTAKEKREHIVWYKEYFADKIDAIQATYQDSLRPKEGK